MACQSTPQDCTRWKCSQRNAGALQEFQRCAHILKRHNCTDAKSRFLEVYSLYLAGERRKRCAGPPCTAACIIHFCVAPPANGAMQAVSSTPMCSASQSACSHFDFTEHAVKATGAGGIIVIVLVCNASDAVLECEFTHTHKNSV